jgi:hypothetical protein
MVNVLQGPIRKLGYALEEVRKLKKPRLNSRLEVEVRGSQGEKLRGFSHQTGAMAL